MHLRVANSAKLAKQNGGGSGIRTHETREGLPDFKSGAFDHSAIPPDLLYYEAPLDTV